MNEKIDYALRNTQKAISELKNYLDEPIVNARDRAGIIQAFEFCYEAIWKLLQKMAEVDGVKANTPREAFVYGFQIGLIIDQQRWLAMIKHRNLTSHVYHEEVASSVLEAIQRDYAPEWQEFLVRVKSRPNI